MKISEEDYIAHYGTPRHSGRYPWGSGDDPYQSSKSMLGAYHEFRKQGMTDVEIAKGWGMSTTELRQRRSNARNAIKAADQSQARRLKERGWSNGAIAERMGLAGESSVRALLSEDAADRIKVLNATSDMLKEQIGNRGPVDIGAGVEHHIPSGIDSAQRLGISRTKLDNAVFKLREEGYKLYHVKIPQLGNPGKFTSMKVLAPPGMEYAEVFKNRFNIKPIADYHTEDGGRTFLGLERPPQSINSKRVKVNYAEDGGAAADGVIYVRPGVDDVSLGKAKYAQVRISVDGTHYLKGMAVYKPDLPPGVDLVFNTNKTRAEAPTKHDAMKPLKRDKAGNIDPDNPFGAVIMPGGQHGVINKLSEEGTWDTWSKTLSSQMLSKQSPVLAEQQLKMAAERKLNEFDEIMSLTNPAVRRHLLEGLASDADSSAVHLKAAHLPRQASKVLLPAPSLKESEIYSPGHNNGERVVLIRHPHGGIFEIPELTVNNRNQEARAMLGTNAPDAVAINPKVAQKLSGADFDGDTVLVIPNNKGAIKTAPALERLKNFDPQRAYPGYEGMPKMKSTTTQAEMGKISNLITDMTIKGAGIDELARAVQHSMVVIDAEKHGLNYKQSAIDNGIPSLKEKYQGGKRAGADTLISLAGSEVRIPKRKMNPRTDPKTGKKIFVETGETRPDGKGQTAPVLEKVKRLEITDDAHTLSSGTKVEKVYADHSNKLKALANTARREAVNTKTTPYSPSARATYKDEVASLSSKLRVAQMNAPRERHAQLIGNDVYEKKVRADPDLTKEEKKKIKQQALAEARTRTGASKDLIEITDNEWNAIQAGAVAPSKLSDILKNADLDQVKKLATPKVAPTMTPVKAARARSMAALGYTQAEIATQLGVSVSTITTVLSEGG